jgi:two-component system, LytTR family, response regulator LytT
MKIVIIEDEKLTARDLKRTILAAEPDIEVAALLHSVEEAIDYFKKNDDTDLIFSDIQLGDGLSFDVFEKMSNPVPVIFCTAHNTYFSEAFKAAGIDYVLKPFTREAIEKALLKYQNLEKKFSKNKEDYKGLLGLLEAKLNPRKSAVIVHQRGKIIPLDAVTIALLYIENGGTYAFTFEQEKFLVNDSLEDLEKSFGAYFFRANRQYLVNRKAIKDASHFFNRKIIINLTVPFKGQVLVGKLKTAAFIDWLAQN